MMYKPKYAELTWDKDPDENVAFRKQLAPIVLFTYKRLEHTKRVVEALQRNMYANESDLFIYSDAPKHINISGGGGEDVSAVTAVREYLHTITGFKSITIIERPKNLGVDVNIPFAVTEVINKFGKAIAVEDDIVTSKYFLKYMNDALCIYRDRKEVMEIAGFCDSIETDGLPQVFFRHAERCWGWATWSDRWQYYTKITKESLKAMTRQERECFDFFGSGIIWTMANCVVRGESDDWSFSWWHTIFQRNGYTLKPSKSLVSNCGEDGTGEHGGFNNRLALTLEDYQITDFPLEIIENVLAKEREQAFYALPLRTRLKTLIYRNSPWWLINFVRSTKRFFGLRTVPNHH